MQREAFKRTHGGDLTKNVSPKPARSKYGYSYQPGYDDPSQKAIPEPREKGGSMAVISLILGVISIIFFFTMPLAMLVALAGIIMAVHVLKNGTDKGLGTAALIASIIGMILALILTGAVIINSDRILRAYDEINDIFSEEFSGNQDLDHFQGMNGWAEGITFDENSLTDTKI